MYYIYHIPDFIHSNGSIGKIGCATNAKNRVKLQGYTNFDILEEHNDIYKASDREIQLQKEYGYPVDKVPYYKTYKQRMDTYNINNCIKGGTAQGRRNVETGHIYTIATFKTRSKAGKIGISKMSREDRVKGAIISGNISANKIHHCPHCNRDIKGRIYFRWHGEKCKYA